MAKSGIFAPAVEGIRGRSCSDGPFFAVHQGHAHTQCAEIDAGDDGHEEASSKRLLARKQAYTIEQQIGLRLNLSYPCNIAYFFAPGSMPFKAVMSPGFDADGLGDRRRRPMAR